MPRIGNLMLSIYREESPTTGQLVEALCQASLEFLPIVLDCDGFRDGRPYKYASIRSIRRSVMPALARYGLWMHHSYGANDEGCYVITVLRHTSNEFLTSTLRVPEIADMQERKAAMTLLCRTSIEGLLSVATEDDSDGSGIVAEEQRPVVDEGSESQKRNLTTVVSAIRSAESIDVLATKASKAADWIREGRLHPSAGEVVEREIANRRDEMNNKAGVITNVDTARNDGTQGQDATGSGGGGATSKQRRAAGTNAGGARDSHARAAVAAE